MYEYEIYEEQEITPARAVGSIIGAIIGETICGIFETLFRKNKKDKP